MFDKQSAELSKDIKDLNHFWNSVNFLLLYGAFFIMVSEIQN